MDLEKQIEDYSKLYSLGFNNSEEIAKAFSDGITSDLAKQIHQQGMYSEEEVKELFYRYTDCNMDPHEFEDFNDWFEQNKKK